MSTATLPSWRSALAVVAHPDDESFALGAVITALVEAGTAVSVLCLTRGEASTLGAVADLSAVRALELARAAEALGVTGVELHEHPDGALARVPLDVLAGEVAAAAQEVDADGVLVFDPSGVTGHADHARATEAALAAASDVGLPVLGWTIPAAVATTLNEEFGAAFDGHEAAEVDVVVRVDRTRQLEAVHCHSTQAVPSSVLWRRLELLGVHEHLRLLR
ncbi:MAG: PIG-L family deacetylase, partial [Actinotalea sp.]|nr:PIG-L family deacetylase [Actinotalea sp.]